MSEQYPSCYGYRVAVFHVRYAARPKKQLSNDFVLPDLQDEAEDTLERGAHNAAYHSLTYSPWLDEINAKFAVWIQKLQLKWAVEWRVDSMAARRVTWLHVLGCTKQ